MAPDTLILDTREVMTKIRQACSVSDCASYAPHAPDFVQDLIQEVVQCLRDRKKAPQVLHNLVQEISTGQCHAGGGYVPPEFAPLVAELGEVLLKQLDNAKAYNYYGILPYHFWVPPFKSITDDVLLQRTQEIPAQ